MKKNRVLTLIGLSIFLTSCSVTVPEQVLYSFEKKFSNAQEVKWSKESKSEYEAEFQMENTEMSANFDANGNCIEIEMVVDPQLLPPPILKTLEEQYKGQDIEKAESTETPKNGIEYEVLIKDGRKSLEIILGDDGVIRSTE